MTMHEYFGYINQHHVNDSILGSFPSTFFHPPRPGTMSELGWWLPQTGLEMQLKVAETKTQTTKHGKIAGKIMAFDFVVFFMLQDARFHATYASECCS